MRMDLDAALNGIISAPPVLVPVIALMTVWMWNAAEDGSPASSCVDAGLILIDALAQYGIGAHLEPVQIILCDAADRPITRYGDNPRWNADGTFNGHAVITLPSIGRFADPTIQQFKEIPALDLAQRPLIAPMPTSVGLGVRPFPVRRVGHIVIYRGFRGDQQHLWQSPVIQATRPQYHAAAANLAANVFDILRLDQFAPKVRQAPYPRLHQLLDELAGAHSRVQDGKYGFQHPATGHLIQLTDIPERPSN
ncbi:MAG: hypothetical protein ACRDNF_11540 [Streptosporangiaceae bacterium]